MSGAPWTPDRPGERLAAELIEDALLTAGIGTWSVDLANQSVRWSAVTRTLHDMEGARHPSLAEALAFYAPEARPRIASAIASGKPWDLELPLITARGRRIWVRTSGRILQAGGVPTHLVGTIADVTERRAEISRRTMAETLLREVMDASPIAVIAYDQDERVIFFNSTYHQIFPRMQGGMRLGASLEEVVRHGLAQGQYPDAGDTEASREAWLAQYLAAHRTPGPSRQLMLADGRWLQLRERRSPSGHLVCTRTDITRLKAAEEEAKRLSELDPLTRLGNRALLFRRLAGLVQGRRQGDPEAACLLIFDLDHFKATNDTLGHPAGDALLQEIASRGLQMLRREDSFVRLGGDEFAILLPGITSAGQALSFIGQLRARMEAPLAYGTATIMPSLSIGVALFPGDAGDTDALFRSADTALYHAKRMGRHCHSFFDRSIAAALERKAELAEQLRRAIARDELSVALQPQLRVRDGAHLGFEALARWSEDAAPVPPSEFIPVAEEMGLIAPLGALVLRQALAAVRHLLDLGLEPGRIAVNVATAQLLSEDFPRQVREALERQQVPAHRLELELTETTLLDRSAERIVHVLRALKALGVSVALDDFGTGYASLSHLTQFQVDRLKIDRRFVRDIGEFGAPSPIARTVIGLAHGLGLEVVAEGVENEAQRRYLTEHNCDIMQGYLVGRPLTLAAAARYLGTVRGGRVVQAAAS
jgi:diguanylate cyclase (GGDEF)-like protein